jgi:hypothetical protein
LESLGAEPRNLSSLYHISPKKAIAAKEKTMISSRRRAKLKKQGKHPKNNSQKKHSKTGQFSQKSILWQNVYNLNREIP